MRKLFLLLLLTGWLIAGAAQAQGSPGFYNGQVLSAADWNAAFAAKQDVIPGAVTGPGVATPGHLATWGSTYPSLADGGAPSSVVAGTCLVVAGAPAYTVSLSTACRAPRGYIDGLGLSTAGSSRSFSTAIGVAMDSTNATAMSLGSAFSKTNASSWAVGSGNGCLDTGSATTSTWYHIFLIEKTDLSAVDVLCSLSSSAPTMPVGWSLFRRIGTLLTTNGTANWASFTQVGNEFRWSTPVNDVNSSTLSTTATNFSLSVPPSVNVVVMLRGYMSSTTPGTKVVVVSPLVTTPVAGTPIGEVTAVAQVAGIIDPFTVEVLTDTAQHVSAVASAASTTLVIDTYGWVDRRGRDN